MSVKICVFLLVRLGEPSERSYLVGQYRKPFLPPVGLLQGVLSQDRICKMMLLTNVSTAITELGPTGLIFHYTFTVLSNS